jgi:DNA-binding transcriptional LysR family regulator
MYDPVQLRTFLAVGGALSFSKAAIALGVGQPTVSAHIRKLEQAVGRALFVRDTHTVRLTADGEAMDRFARTILAAHDQAVSFFTGSGLSGRLRFGVTDDLALTPVPRILRDFRHLYPKVNLELTVAQNDVLHRRLESGHLDMAYVKRAPEDGSGRIVRRDRLVWTSAPGAGLVEPPVPLVVYQAPSISRSLAVQALDAAGTDYRVTCTVRGVLGAVAAARAGLGLAIFARSLIPADLVEVPTGAGLPELGEIDLVLLTNTHTATASVEALTAAILANGHPMTSQLTSVRSPTRADATKN